MDTDKTVIVTYKKTSQNHTDGNTGKDGGKQTKNNSAKPPKTGDTSSAGLWMALLFASGSAVTLTVLAGRKRKHNR